MTDEQGQIRRHTYMSDDRSVGWSRPTAHLNTPPTQSADVSTEEIVIRNPSHPLFGRRFRVHHRSHRPIKDPSVVVFYTQEILLRIPTSALTEPQEPPTKLTLESMAELVSTFRVATSSCPPKKPLSGPLSPST